MKILLVIINEVTTLLNEALEFHSKVDLLLLPSN